MTLCSAGESFSWPRRTKGQLKVERLELPLNNSVRKRFLFFVSIAQVLAMNENETVGKEREEGRKEENEEGKKGRVEGKRKKGKLRLGLGRKAGKEGRTESKKKKGEFRLEDLRGESRDEERERFKEK